MGPAWVAKPFGSTRVQIAVAILFNAPVTIIDVLANTKGDEQLLFNPWMETHPGKMMNMWVSYIVLTCSKNIHLS